MYVCMYGRAGSAGPLTREPKEQGSVGIGWKYEQRNEEKKTKQAEKDKYNLKAGNLKSFTALEIKSRFVLCKYASTHTQTQRCINLKKKKEEIMKARVDAPLKLFLVRGIVQARPLCCQVWEGGQHFLTKANQQS